MKVLTEKKPTLSIYTGVDYTGDNKKMERVEVREAAKHRKDPKDTKDPKEQQDCQALRKQLDETRAALRLQSARCRQLVAAYSARLRAGDTLRDHQLTLVLRALVALEARLRREQKAIRAQLAQRDAIIHQQQVEISRLRASQPPPPAPPPARAAPSAAATPSQLIVVNHTCGQDSACEPPPSRGRSPRKARPHAAPHAAPQDGRHETVVDASHLRHQEATLRVLELTTSSMPLLNGETACIVDAGIEPPADFIEDTVTPPPDVVASYHEMNRECMELANMAASLRSDKSVFQDNPVLECVNLILLRDQEDFQEERRGPRSQSRGQGRGGRSQGRGVEEEPEAWYNTKEAPRRPTPPALPPKPPRLASTRPTPAAKSVPSKDSKQDAPSKRLAPRAADAPTPPQSPDSPAAPPAPPTTPPPAPTPAPTAPAAERKAENDANDALRRNFEEFNLDDCEIEGLGDLDGPLPEGRPEGDGAECKLNGLPPQDILALTAPAEAPLGLPLSLSQAGQTIGEAYDTFLEATGLSNKSILTPSRMLSNHRSVLKPKDVKHRSRVKAGERCLTTAAAGPTVKYWTEPFL